MTRTLTILPFLLIACNPAGKSTEEQPDRKSKTEQSSPDGSSTEASNSSEEVGYSMPEPAPEVQAAMVAPPIEVTPSWQTQVVAGENLGLLSNWSRSSVEEIGELNDFDVAASIHPGQSIKLPFENEAEIEAFRQARAKGHQHQLDRYLSSRGGLVDMDLHVVQTGDTAWEIANTQTGIPMWVLASFNPDTDMQSLGIGQSLQVPVLGDTVASLELEEVPELEAEIHGLTIDFD